MIIEKKEIFERKISCLREIISDMEVIIIPEATFVKKKLINDEISCHICGKNVKNFQALGGHMAQMHKKANNKIDNENVKNNYDVKDNLNNKDKDSGIKKSKKNFQFGTEKKKSSAESKKH